MAALGMGPGEHMLGEYTVHVDAASARLADGTLAGSILSLDTAIRNLVSITGCDLSDAFATVTTTPAALLGLQGERGRIAPGYLADLTVLTPDLRVAKTIIGGRIAYEAPPARRHHDTAPASSDPVWRHSGAASPRSSH
jgi:N-acetylglucosamine-6-phosphate deacetylase